MMIALMRDCVNVLVLRQPVLANCRSRYYLCCSPKLGELAGQKPD